MINSNSREEFVFKPVYEKRTGHKLRHGNPQEPDWLDKQNGLGIEVKGISYRLDHFKDGLIRVNAESLSRHARENPNILVSLVFSSGEILIAPVKLITERSTIEPSQVIGDRQTYLTPLSIFDRWA